MAASLGSSYLLQNLLIGQIQQLTGSPHPPNSHFLPPTGKAGAGELARAGEQLLEGGAGAGGVAAQLLPSSTIPLLSGQIVAQLNSLLFSVHGITDKVRLSHITYHLNITIFVFYIFTNIDNLSWILFRGVNFH